MARHHISPRTLDNELNCSPSSFSWHLDMDFVVVAFYFFITTNLGSHRVEKGPKIILFDFKEFSSTLWFPQQMFDGL